MLLNDNPMAVGFCVLKIFFRGYLPEIGLNGRIVKRETAIFAVLFYDGPVVQWIE